VNIVTGASTSDDTSNGSKIASSGSSVGAMSGVVTLSSGSSDGASEVSVQPGSADLQLRVVSLYLVAVVAF